tara:strand:- start:417 stop:974 length:558 start_codon:yes stop_codon:yes gene_type:complete
MKDSDNNKDYIDPKVASKIVEENDPPYKVPEEGNGNGNGNGNADVRENKTAELLSSTADIVTLKKAELASALAMKKADIARRKAEIKGEIEIIRARSSAKDLAGKHIAKLGGFYLCLIVLSFLYSITSGSLSGDSLGVITALVTLVVSSITGLLAGISGKPEKKDSAELMHDLLSTIIEKDEEKK